MKKQAFFVFLLVFSASVFATDDYIEPKKTGLFSLPEIPVMLSPRAKQLTPGEIYSKTQAVLAHFGVPEENSNSDLAQIYDHQQTKAEFERIQNILDTSKQLPRFIDIDETGVRAFDDRDALQVEDVFVAFSPDGVPSYESVALNRLRKAKNNPIGLPLQGIKIAIDPGHMSTKEWDKITGKFVKDTKGHTISEGMINLQTSLLLQQEFENLGATVMLTRDHHLPVTTLPYANLDINEFGKRALRAKSLNNWFLNLLASAPIGSTLYSNFQNSVDFKKLFAKEAKANYFVVNADLEARVETMEAFAPDITLVIHYDAFTNKVNTSKYSKVKTYIHGSLDPEEWSTRDDRRYVLHHLLDSASWDASRLLAEEVVKGLKTGLKLEFDKGGGGSSKMVSPGVFARNLFITRKMYGHAHTYVECLHYNDPSEFKAMKAKDFTLVIDGQNTFYSKRLKEVVTSIKNGVLNFMTKI
jgi:N-acetylmuramoyl-L-alanine amidase